MIFRMKLVGLLVSLLAVAREKVYQAEPTSCTSVPCLIFEDEFTDFDTDVWEHEITAGGGGNWEFQYYTNNRSNSYVENGVLFIKPTLTEDAKGDGFVSSGNLNLWGSNGIGDVCTGNGWYGCEKQGTDMNYINPIQSARLRTAQSFGFRYGMIEVVAKLPKGDWIWPAVWLLPRGWPYGPWPASGEIDIMESRGNENLKDPLGHDIGVQTMGSTLHFGPYWPENGWDRAHAEKTLDTGDFGSAFHKYGLRWTDTYMNFYVDDELILTVDPQVNFWVLGGWNKSLPSYSNPWRGGGKMAPFDREFYIIMNVAVGGTNGYFSDDAVSPDGNSKPWDNSSPTAPKDFYLQKDKWYPTWTKGGVWVHDDAALKIDSVRVWKMELEEQENAATKCKSICGLYQILLLIFIHLLNKSVAFNI